MTSGPSVHDSDQCEAGLQHAARLLHDEFDASLAAPDVDAVMARVTSRFADATVLNFVPLLVRRYAREALLRRVEARGEQGHVSESALFAMTEPA